MTAPLTIHLNGAPRHLTEPTIASALMLLGRDPAERGLAIALNDQVLPRGEWSRIVLAHGDSVEVVSARQGG